ncbi:radical SAM family heme chaperone HemW [Ekhidna sp.]|uniref:radical SAM family heme chaperone HemW n=1 Tax=Ekhidna sp. TaxID=2608089 RepID=UPI003C7DD242
MAGIYIHIPFCRQACHYCDFHFSTNLSKQEEMVDAISWEIRDRRDYLHEDVETIYFGGGTPSLLSGLQLKKLFDTINQNFNISGKAEITLEANPEDLTEEYSNTLLDSGINRLSIGIQTFDEQKLKWMNRVHTADEAIQGYENARATGFSNISLDLIYAIPDHDREEWKKDLASINSLNPEHISLYGLTIEEKTVFRKWEKENKLIQVPEDAAAEQYLYAIDFLKAQGYNQYEVSNFGREGYHSRHNHAYWAGVPYLGVGPGAHSFDGQNTRSFNVRNNARYMKAINESLEHVEHEALSDIQRINERILTGLRTKKGVDLNQIASLADHRLEELHSDFLNEMERKNMIERVDEFLRLKPHGFLVADEIALRLFFSDE